MPRVLFPKTQLVFFFSYPLFILRLHFHVASYVWQRARRTLLLSTFTHLHVPGFCHDFCTDQLQLSVKKALSTMVFYVVRICICF